MGRTYKEVAEYVEWQNHGAGKVLSAKPEHHFDDLGDTVTVWNVKTDNDGDWWVVEGNHTPMNLYPQSAYYFQQMKFTHSIWALWIECVLHATNTVRKAMLKQ